MHHTYIPHGVCSRKMEFDLENGVVRGAEVKGGCNGNLKGICSLIEGQQAEDVIARLSGIRCGLKKTSCPDQLAIALREALDEESR